MQEFPAMRGQISASDIEAIMNKEWPITSAFFIDTDLSSVTLGMETGVSYAFPQIKHPKEQCQLTANKTRRLRLLRERSAWNLNEYSSILASLLCDVQTCSHMLSFPHIRTLVCVRT